MTPFELHLQNGLDVERQRFANKWLFPWHNINIPGRIVDVEDNRGGRFSVGGVAFQGQLQQMYWQAIDRYLGARIHETFRQWNEETETYPDKMRHSSLDGTERLLSQFVGEIIKRAQETDRRLRGRGFPDQVKVYDASREHAHARSEVLRLADSHRALFEGGAPRTRPSVSSGLRHSEQTIGAQLPSWLWQLRSCSACGRSSWGKHLTLMPHPGGSIDDK